VIAGDIVVVLCGGPKGSGMQEIYQVTSALKHLPFGKDVAVITDARFSGVSTGACIGHVSPEALAGGAIGKLRDKDLIEIVVDQESLRATVNFVGEGEERFDPAEGARRLSERPMRQDLAPDPRLPDDTKLWAALVHASGGIWAGCVYDTEAIVDALSRKQEA
jgi:xylonate dehydratase